MSKAGKRRTQKHRRKTKAVLKHGQNARPIHKMPAGRTGSIQSSRLKNRPKGPTT